MISLWVLEEESDRVMQEILEWPAGRALDEGVMRELLVEVPDAATRALIEKAGTVAWSLADARKLVWRLAQLSALAEDQYARFGDEDLAHDEWRSYVYAHVRSKGYVPHPGKYVPLKERARRATVGAANRARPSDKVRLLKKYQALYEQWEARLRAEGRSPLEAMQRARTKAISGLGGTKSTRDGFRTWLKKQEKARDP